MVGRESDRHLRYKGRVANILRRFGFTVFGDHDDEIAIQPRERTAPPYYVDICAVSGSRIIIVEIDGYRGHKSRYGILKDKNRSVEIKDILSARAGKPEIYRFGFWQLKGMDDDTIAEELKIC